MRLASSTLSESILSQIKHLGEKQALLQTQVATNQRISTPSDDPAAARRVMALESERRTLEQYGRNIGRTREISQASLAGLQQLKKVADRATEIAASTSGAFDPTQGPAYAAEINQLVEQAVQLGNSRFGGDYLYAGTATDTPPFTVTRDSAGQVIAAVYAGNSSQLHLALGEHSEVSAGTSGPTNAGLGQLINRLVALRDGLNAPAPAAVTSAGTGLQASGDDLVAAIADQAAVQLRLEVQDSIRNDSADRVERLVSTEVDADLASTMVRLNQTSVAYQAALQSAASIMKTSLMDYLQ
jgi:flagellar hook-associated protein 3 FlgL